jgi:hypothetical protein
MGLAGAWLTADYYAVGLDAHDADVRAALTLVVPPTCAVLGLIVSARAIAQRRWLVWGVATAGTLVAGAAIGIGLAVFFQESRVIREGMIPGLVTAHLFLPAVVAAMYLARRVGRARAGSLVDESDRRGSWLVVATAVAAAQVAVAHGDPGPWNHQPVTSFALGVLAIGSLATMAWFDLAAYMEAQRAMLALVGMRPRAADATTGCPDVLDLGLGDEEHEELEQGGSAYRTNERPQRIVRGDSATAFEALRRALVRSFTCLIAAIVLFAIARASRS